MRRPKGSSTSRQKIERMSASKWLEPDRKSPKCLLSGNNNNNNNNCFEGRSLTNKCKYKPKLPRQQQAKIDPKNEKNRSIIIRRIDSAKCSKINNSNGSRRTKRPISAFFNIQKLFYTPTKLLAFTLVTILFAAFNLPILSGSDHQIIQVAAADQSVVSSLDSNEIRFHQLQNHRHHKQQHQSNSIRQNLHEKQQLNQHQRNQDLKPQNHYSDIRKTTHSHAYNDELSRRLRLRQADQAIFTTTTSTTTTAPSVRLFPKTKAPRNYLRNPHHRRHPKSNELRPLERAHSSLSQSFHVLTPTPRLIDTTQAVQSMAPYDLTDLQEGQVHVATQSTQSKSFSLPADLDLGLEAYDVDDVFMDDHDNDDDDDDDDDDEDDDENDENDDIDGDNDDIEDEDVELGSFKEQPDDEDAEVGVESDQNQDHIAGNKVELSDDQDTEATVESNEINTGSLASNYHCNRSSLRCRNRIKSDGISKSPKFIRGRPVSARLQTTSYELPSSSLKPIIKQHTSTRVAQRYRNHHNNHDHHHDQVRKLAPIPRVPYQTPVVVSISDNSFVSASPIVEARRPETLASNGDKLHDHDPDDEGDDDDDGGDDHYGVDRVKQGRFGDLDIVHKVGQASAKYSNLLIGSHNELPSSSVNRQRFWPSAQPHLASIRMVQEDPNEYQRASGFDSAIVAILFGLGVTGMLVMIVGMKMRSIRERMAHKGRRRSLVPDADFLINTIPT